MWQISPDGQIKPGRWILLFLLIFFFWMNNTGMEFVRWIMLALVMTHTYLFGFAAASTINYLWEKEGGMESGNGGERERTRENEWKGPLLDIHSECACELIKSMRVLMFVLLHRFTEITGAERQIFFFSPMNRKNREWKINHNEHCPRAHACSVVIWALQDYRF